MDLSPGGSTPPVIALAGCIVSFFTRKFYHAGRLSPRMGADAHRQTRPWPERVHLSSRHESQKQERPEVFIRAVLTTGCVESTAEIRVSGKAKSPTQM